MRTPTFLLALLLAATALAAPAAVAKPYCTYAESGCPGLVCVYATQTCADDCPVTCVMAAGPAFDCVPLYSGPFSSGKLCVDASQAPRCAVYVDTYSMGETSRQCYGVLGGKSAAGLSGCEHLLTGYGWDSYLCYDTKAPATCMLWTETVWSEGGASKSCFPNLPTDVPPGADDVLRPADVECYDIYSQHHVGPVTITQRSSCDYEVTWDGEPLLQ